MATVGIKRLISTIFTMMMRYQLMLNEACVVWLVAAEGGSISRAKWSTRSAAVVSGQHVYADAPLLVVCSGRQTGFQRDTPRTADEYQLWERATGEHWWKWDLKGVAALARDYSGESGECKLTSRV